MNPKAHALSELLAVVERLRDPGGCPWDRQQTLADVARFLLEEVSEVEDAVHEGGGRPSPAVREELGDVLMNVFLASRIAEEEGAFSVADVAGEIRDKLVRRHPHVFGEGEARTAEEVLATWNAIKAKEKEAAGEAPTSRLDGVPRSLPPLARAYRMGEKAARAGFDWTEASQVLEKLEEEIRELREALAAAKDSPGTGSDSGRAPGRIEDELGDFLFAAVSLCRKLGCHPDRALRTAMEKFETRFRELERRLGDLEGASLESMDAVWNEIKAGRP